MTTTTRTPRKKKPAAPSTAQDLAVRIAQIADEAKGESILVLDLRGLTDLTDFFVIATARSAAHSRALLKTAREKLREEGIRPISPPEDESPRWSVLDFADVVFHVFDAEARDHYQLEQAWGDAEPLDWIAHVK